MRFFLKGMPFILLPFIALHSIPQAGAQEISGGECPAAFAKDSGYDFDIGWFHNKPSLTVTQDGYSPNIVGDHGSAWPERNWPDGQIGANQLVVNGHGLDEVKGPGLTLYDEGSERSRLLIAGAPGPNTTLADAVAGDTYMQYAFTTQPQPMLHGGAFFRKVHVLSYPASKFKYAVRVSTSSTFDTYWTVVQDVQVDRPGTDSNGWYHFPADATKRAVLKPNTTYYVRLYLYDHQSDAVIATNSSTEKHLPPPGTPVIVADDFMLGTGVCDLPKVTLTKVSNGKAGIFNFSGDNGYPSHPITTASSGVGVTHTTQTLQNAGVATVLTEAPTAGFKLSSITCAGTGSGSATNSITGNGAAGGSVTLDAAAVAWGANITCTFTNDSTEADLSLTKTNTETSLVSGNATTYTLVVSNKGPGAADGAILKDVPDATHLTNCTVLPGCVTSGTAACPTQPNDILTAGGAPIPSLKANSSVTLKVQCDVL